MTNAKLGDIVQITKEGHACYPCLVIVAGGLGDGIEGFIALPEQDVAFVRLKHENYALVGKALVTIVPEKEEDER